ncbi:MAG: hypothetical protein A2033_17085 [Bacteroidetes bacterium GWA2_31_9]|nr:MAG: hypothetical protein A2033_17085 [Bacteroidetes bacterium GWA2_31_9]
MTTLKQKLFKTKSLLLISFILLTYSTILSQPVINSVTENSNTVSKYSKFELTVSITATYSNAYDYGDMHLSCELNAPNGSKDTVDGFLYQDYTITDANGNLSANGSPVWKIRFAPDVTGTWTYKVICTDGTGMSAPNNGSFICSTSTDPGFVRKANNTFLKFDNGSLYFAIGENVGWYGTKKVYDYKLWLDSLAANGCNYIRVWMAAWSFAVEWNNTGLGNYHNRQDRAFMLDWVINYASQKGIYIQLCLINHGQFSTNVNPEWDTNPYNSNNGGPINYPGEFFSNTNAKNLFKRKLRYLNARWGYSKNLMAWELCNEIDWVDNYTNYSSSITYWHDEMAKYLKGIDVNNHLVTTSYAHDYYESATWNLSSIDYTQIHKYENATDPILTQVSQISTYRSYYNKPVIMGEFGFESLSYTTTNDPNGISLHNSTWANCFTGGFGSALPWWWDNYIHPYNLYYHYKPITNYMATTDLLSETHTPLTPSCYNDSCYDHWITPAFTTFAIAPEHYFVIDYDGNISPSSSNLGKYLFGSNYNTQYRNPPTFNVKYKRAGQFKVITGSTTGASPIIKIWMDNNLVLSENASINTTYTITVPSGTHNIYVDNQGTDWISIAGYVFFNSNIRSYSLKGTTKTYGWIQNKNYNWEYLQNYGTPSLVKKGSISLYSMANGSYNVKWYKCFPFQTLGDTDIVVSNGRLLANIPNFNWDIAYSVTKNTTTLIINKDDVLKNDILVYPNPFNDILNVSGVQIKEISIFDIKGNSIFNTKCNNTEFFNKSFNNIATGTYLLKVKTNSNTYSVKIVKE